MSPLKVMQELLKSLWLRSGGFVRGVVSDMRARQENVQRSRKGEGAPGVLEKTRLVGWGVAGLDGEAVGVKEQEGASVDAVGLKLYVPI